MGIQPVTLPSPPATASTQVFGFHVRGQQRLQETGDATPPRTSEDFQLPVAQQRLLLEVRTPGVEIPSSFENGKHRRLACFPVGKPRLYEAVRLFDVWQWCF